MSELICKQTCMELHSNCEESGLPWLYSVVPHVFTKSLFIWGNVFDKKDGGFAQAMIVFRLS